MTCPLGCGPLVADPTALRDNRTGLPHTMRVAWCPVCGLGVTLNPSEDLGALYEAAYLGEEGRIPATGRLARAWHLFNGSLPLTDMVSEGPVLDVGSNTGEALVALERQGLDVTGVEPNPEAVRVARGRGIEVIQAPIEDAALPEGRFGSIVLSQVLEHVRDPHAVLRKVRPALREDGTVFLVVPNAGSVFRRLFGPDWVHWHVPFHLFHFTQEALRKLCAQCGLEITSTRNVTPGEWLLMSLETRRNARRGVYTLESWSGRYMRRLLVAPAGRLADAFHRGDAIVAQARSSRYTAS